MGIVFNIFSHGSCLFQAFRWFPCGKRPRVELDTPKRDKHKVAQLGGCDLWTLQFFLLRWPWDLAMSKNDRARAWQLVHSQVISAWKHVQKSRHITFQNGDLKICWTHLCIIQYIYIIYTMILILYLRLNIHLCQLFLRSPRVGSVMYFPGYYGQRGIKRYRCLWSFCDVLYLSRFKKSPRHVHWVSQMERAVGTPQGATSFVVRDASCLCWLGFD